MKKKLFTKILALVLMLTLLPCLGGGVAWADVIGVKADGTTETAESVDVTTTADDTIVKGVLVENGGTATISGDVSATNNAADPSNGSVAAGIIVDELNAGSTSTVNVGGNVSASSNSTQDVYDYADGVEANADGMPSKAIVNITGDVSAKTTGTGEALGILAESGSFSTVEVTAGDVTAKAEGTGVAEGIYAFADCESSTTVTVGKVEATAEEHNSLYYTNATGISVDSIDGSSVTVTAASVKTEAKKGVAQGIVADAKGASTVDIMLNTPDEDGTVLAVAGAESAEGSILTVIGKGSSVNLTAEGDISVESEQSGVGITVKTELGGNATVSVDGNLTVDGKQTTGINVSNEEGLVDVDIFGNVEAATSGITVDNTGAAMTSILVDGSVSADLGIIVGSQTTADNLEITVWQVDKTNVAGEEHVVVNSDSAARITDNTKQIEQSINYIIKIKPSQESIISLSGTTDKDGYKTAHMGDKVAMKVNVPNGYRLTGAFGDKGEKLPLKVDSDGNYYIIVPMGGGVYLSAVLDRISDGVDYSTYVAKTGMATVTFDLNAGHTITGNPGPIVKVVPVGTWLRLIEAPSKDGAEFELWHTDDETIKASTPMESFLVQGDVTFTAKWVDEEIAYQPTADETNLVSSLSSVATIPVVEETSEEAPAEEVPTVEDAAIEEAVEPVAERAVTSPKTGNEPKNTDDRNADKVNETVEASPAISLSDLSGSGEGLNLKAKLVIDLGGGQTLELPVNIKVTLG